VGGVSRQRVGKNSALQRSKERSMNGKWQNVGKRKATNGAHLAHPSLLPAPFVDLLGENHSFWRSFDGPEVFHSSPMKKKMNHAWVVRV
jgi:hypothetical protein